MADQQLTDLLERLVLAGVALTTRALSEASSEFDLTFPQWRALLVVGERPAGAKVSEVASRVGVTLPATSRQLRRLARRGLMEIARDPRDRRVVRVRLTVGGVAVRDEILRYRRERIAEGAARLRLSSSSLDDLARIADALDAIAEGGADANG